MFEFLFRGGTVIDGSGRGPAVRDIAVRGDRIAAVGDLRGGSAGRTIDISGLTVAPGFIDAHSHGDASVLAMDCDDSKTRQGVTTEVIGNCGDSLAPVEDRTLSTLAAYLDVVFGRPAIDWSWRTMADYRRKVEEHGVPTNILPLVGHGTVRVAAMGFDDRPPTGAELDHMKALVAGAMEDGAAGLSTGLIYPPGCYAGTEELVELARLVGVHGGLYASHIRGEGRTLLDAVDEAVRVGREAGVPVQISHCKVAGRPNWGKSAAFLERIEQARATGVDVTGDQYPYLAGSANLSSLLPHWAHEGGVERLLARLRDPDTRERIKNDLRSEGSGLLWDNLLSMVGFDDVLLVSAPTAPDLEGRTLGQVASGRGTHPHDTLMDILVETAATVQMVTFLMADADMERILASPWVMAGSDSLIHSGKPHPRNYGTFPRLIGFYARQKHVVTLPEAVRKMTSLPAQKFGLRDRGYIAEGMAADIVVFDAGSVIDRATYQDPVQYPGGIEYVLVNGIPAVLEGKTTGALPGKVLRRQRGGTA